MAVWFEANLSMDALNQLGANSMTGHLGIRFVDWGEDWLAAEMPVDDRTRQPFGLLHGGASVALAETVSSVAGTMTLPLEKQFVVGMEINANHIRSAREGIVRATAKAEHLGRSAQVWSIRITDEQHRLVCLSRATLAVLDRRGERP